MKQIKEPSTTESLSGSHVQPESFVIEVGDAESVSIHSVYSSDTPSAKTFDSPAAALLVVQDLTFTAADPGIAGNDISIEYTGGATAGAEVVSVVDTAISIQIESGVSTATQIKTAFDASVAALALASCAVSGTGSNAQTTASETPLAGGTAGEVNLTNEQLAVPSHGLTTGLKGQLTTTGTLPTGLSLATDYFVIAVDDNTIKLATSLDNANAGTAVNITGYGSGTHTFTPTALAGCSLKLQESNVDEDSAYVDVSGKSFNITGSGNTIWSIAPTTKFFRLKLAITAGSVALTSTTHVKYR